MERIKSLSRIKWANLTSTQKSQRKLSLEVLRLMRKGNSFSSATKEIGLSPYLSKKNLGRYLKKGVGRYFSAKLDSIQRAMQIYENGKIKSIIVRNSKDASKIGEYFNEVRKTLRGDSSGLKRFKKIVIKDSERKKHKLETKPEKIFDIEETKEDSEFFEVYDDE